MSTNQPPPNPKPEDLMAQLNIQKPEKSPGLSVVLKDVQTGLAVITGIVALFTATGFVIVNTHLLQYTDIFSYRLDSAQYIGASISFLLVGILPMLIGFLIAYLGMARLERKRAQRYFFWVGVMVFVLTVIAFLVDPKLTLSFGATPIFSAFIGFSGGYMPLEMSHLLAERFTERRRTWLLAGIAAYAILGVGGIYGSVTYGKVPRSIGGGQPATARLIFSGETEAVKDILTRPDATSAGGESINVCILAQLSDGLLVYRPDTRTTLAMNSSTVLAVHDAQEFDADCRRPLEIDNEIPGLLSILFGSSATPEVTSEATTESTPDPADAIETPVP